MNKTTRIILSIGLLLFTIAFVIFVLKYKNIEDNKEQIDKINQTLLFQERANKCYNYQDEIQSIIIKNNLSLYQMPYSQRWFVDIYLYTYIYKDVEITNLNNCMAIKKISKPINNIEELKKLENEYNSLISNYLGDCFEFEEFGYTQEIEKTIIFYCDKEQCIRKLNEQGECEYFEV